MSSIRLFFTFQTLSISTVAHLIKHSKSSLTESSSSPCHEASHLYVLCSHLALIVTAQVIQTVQTGTNGTDKYRQVQTVQTLIHSAMVGRDGSVLAQYARWVRVNLDE